MTLHIMPERELTELGWRVTQVEDNRSEEPYFLYSRPGYERLTSWEAWQIEDHGRVLVERDTVAPRSYWGEGGRPL